MTKGEVLGEEVEVAETPRSRARGLIGTDCLPARGGLFLRPCRSVHTFGMRYPIDVAFLDHQGRVLRTVENLPPNRVTSVVWRARGALELPAGKLKESGTERGDLLAIG